MNKLMVIALMLGAFQSAIAGNRYNQSDFELSEQAHERREYRQGNQPLCRTLSCYRGELND